MSEEITLTTETKGNKDVVLRFRTTAGEKELIEKKAKKAGVKPAVFMRNACLGKEIQERIPADVRRHIVGVGSNLNQLTRLANSGKLSVQSQEKLGQLLGALSDLLLVA